MRTVLWQNWHGPRRSGRCVHCSLSFGDFEEVCDVKVTDGLWISDDPGHAYVHKGCFASFLHRHVKRVLVS